MGIYGEHTIGGLNGPMAAYHAKGTQADGSVRYWKDGDIQYFDTCRAEEFISGQAKDGVFPGGYNNQYAASYFGDCQGRKLDKQFTLKDWEDTYNKTHVDVMPSFIYMSLPDNHTLGTNLGMWDGQMPALVERFRVLRYDSRGHGQSAAPPGPYRIEELGRDLIALLDALDIPRVRFCGLSKGGMVGMWLASNAPERVERLVDSGHLKRNGPRVALTAEGRLLLDCILGEIAAPDPKVFALG